MEAFVGAQHIHAAVSVLVVGPDKVRRAAARIVGRTKTLLVRRDVKRDLDLVDGEVELRTYDQSHGTSDVRRRHARAAQQLVIEVTSTDSRAYSLAGRDQIRLATTVRTWAFAAED